jgi:hypothetical protein
VADSPLASALRDENRFLRERVVNLETQNQKLTTEMLELRRQGWSPRETIPDGSVAVTRVNLPSAVIAAIQQREHYAPGGAQQLMNWAITQIAASIPEGDVVRTILEGVSDA